jgi:colanic acid/amylovoran biosynthesis glycosyltransferase
VNTVMIYREELLPLSETFIISQARLLRSFNHFYAGLNATPKRLSLDSVTYMLTTSSGTYGRLRAKAYRSMPLAPGFHQRLRSARPSLIHAHFALDGTSALEIQRLLGVPLVVTLHGYDVTTRRTVFARTFGGRRYLRTLPDLWKTAERFLCVSEAIHKIALAAGFPEEKLITHYIGIDRTKFAPRPQSERDPNLVVFVGRLVEKKGCEYLLHAMRYVQEACSKAEVVIIGTGPLLVALTEDAAAMGVRARFFGAEPQDVVRDYIGRARVLCNPSVTASTGDSEGFGMVFGEAQAMGTPVVSTRHGGIPEAVVDGETGLLAEERDAVGLARNIERFLTDDTFWQACSDRAITHVRDNFDLHTQTRKLEAIYDEVIREGGSRYLVHKEGAHAQ